MPSLAHKCSIYMLQSSQISQMAIDSACRISPYHAYKHVNEPGHGRVTCSNMVDGGQFPADYSVLTCEAYQAGERTNRTDLDLMAAMKAVRLRSVKVT